jgi:hypothetical protein
VPALRQQERRAALVGVFRHYLEEERLRTGFEQLHQKWSLTPVLSAPNVVMSHWPQPKLSRTSPTQRPSSGPDPRENSGVEIPSHLTVVSDDSSGPNTYGGQAAGRKTDSAQVTHHRSRSASTGSSSVACSEQAQKEYFYVHPNRRTNHQARQK